MPQDADQRLKDAGFKKLEKPYLVRCPHCSGKMLRTTNIPTKSCYCGTRLIFGRSYDIEEG